MKNIVALETLAIGTHTNSDRKSGTYSSEV